jgi:hypothetical protein
MQTTKGYTITALAVFAAGLAYAADQTILGNSLTVRNPSTPEKRKIVGKAKEPNSPNTIVGDPTMNGGSLTVTANGGSPSSQIFNLPQGVSGMTGRPFWSGTATQGFKYKDPKGENGAVKRAAIKKTPSGNFSIKAIVSGKLGPVNVLPPNPGTSGCMLLKLKFGDTYSVAFLAGDGTTSNSGATLYKQKKVTMEGSCLAAPPTTSTTSTTTTSSTTTTTLYGSPSRAFLDRAFGLLD